VVGVDLEGGHASMLARLPDKSFVAGNRSAHDLVGLGSANGGAR
jgi:hypothetical protein